VNGGSGTAEELLTKISTDKTIVLKIERYSGGV